MSRVRLSDETVALRMVELRNLRRMHAADRKQIAALKAENKQLRAENIELQATVATLQIQIAELQVMVFGKKVRPPHGGAALALPKPTSDHREASSYRRPLPPATAITAEVVVPLPTTCSCGGTFDSSQTTVHERYEEDIPLPELTPGYQAHLVTKYRVERGICRQCGKATASQDLGGAEVFLGSNARLLICHLVAGLGMTYSQVTNLLGSLYGLRVTDGEIANVLRKQHQTWLPSYTRLRDSIRAAPVNHVDETSWPIQALEGHGYAWCLCNASNQDVCYALEQSRGATHAKTLFGQATNMPFGGVRISDNYSPYRNPELPGQQQLCWVHLYRVIRDLRYNSELPKEQLTYVTRWYEAFAAIYQDLRDYLDAPYDEVQRTEQATALWQRVSKLAGQSARPKAGEPHKLTALRSQLLQAGKDRLLVCLPKDTPCDNNRAERDLRQLVLKRKRSFGSKTEKGAQALATILSLCTTTWRRHPNNYFQQLALLG